MDEMLQPSFYLKITVEHLWSSRKLSGFFPNHNAKGNFEAEVISGLLLIYLHASV